MSKVPSYFRQDGKDQVQTSKYGYRIHPVTGAKQDFHTGGDYRSASGTPLVSPCDGVVTLAKLYTTGYGGRVLIYNEVANVTLAITHMEKLSVATGQVVKKGQLIGLSGGAKGDKYAGTSTGSHLHISVIKGRATSIPGKEDRFYHDPEKFDWKALEPKPKPVVKSVTEVAREVIAGKYGVGAARKKALGSRYAAVQAEVNRLLGSKPTAPKPTVDIDNLARRTYKGEFGNGAERKKRLGKNYAAVQARVNELYYKK